MTDPADIDLSDVSPRVFEAVVVAIGGIITAVGVVSFILAYGLLKGMGWAWTLTVVLPIISILLNAISLQENLGGIVCVIISGIILYYIYRYLSSHILEEVRVLHFQQPPRHSVFAIETC